MNTDAITIYREAYETMASATFWLAVFGAPCAGFVLAYLISRYRGTLPSQYQLAGWERLADQQRATIDELTAALSDDSLRDKLHALEVRKAAIVAEREGDL